ncbi:MAG: heavy metal-binding domain-containing protein [Bacteroidia bacterium]
MKKTIFISAAAIALMIGACKNSSNKSESTNASDSTNTQDANTAQVFNLDTNTLASGATYYQCSMDPEIISDKAGNCTKCGMELSEMKKN